MPSLLLCLCITLHSGCLVGFSVTLIMRSPNKGGTPLYSQENINKCF